VKPREGGGIMGTKAAMETTELALWTAVKTFNVVEVAQAKGCDTVLLVSHGGTVY
jgi:hypothetical protein